MKNKRNVIIAILFAVTTIIVLIYTYPRSVVNFVEPLKNGEELENIFIVHQKFNDSYVVKITDKETISRLLEQMEKVRVRYWRIDDPVVGSEDNYLLTMEFNHPDHSVTIQKDGRVYWNHKQYFPVDDETMVLFDLLEKISEEMEVKK